MIVVVDYNVGNTGSILNVLRRIGVAATVSNSPEIIEAATKLILPGVGAFDRGVQHLEQFNLFPVLRRVVIERGVPLLGICLGMQLLGDSSEEGTLPGLGLI